MANRPALVRQSDATKLLKAAKAAGWTRVRLVYRDGNVELVAEELSNGEPVEINPLDQWRSNNGQG